MQQSPTDTIFLVPYFASKKTYIYIQNTESHNNVAKRVSHDCLTHLLYFRRVICDSCGKIMSQNGHDSRNNACNESLIGLRFFFTHTE